VRCDVVRRFVAAATSPSDRIGLRRTVGDGGGTPSRLQRTGIAAAAPRTAPDGPPTDSEHAECIERREDRSRPRGLFEQKQTWRLRYAAPAKRGKKS